MNRTEAVAWIRGERSLANIVPQDPFPTWQARIAEADAATTQQAYWILRAHHDGLLEAEIVPPSPTLDWPLTPEEARAFYAELFILRKQDHEIATLEGFDKLLAALHERAQQASQPAAGKEEK